MKLKSRSIVFSAVLVGLSNLANLASFDAEASFTRQNSFKLAPDYEVFSYTGASGLRVLALPQRGTGAVSVVVAYDVGSRFEPSGRTGLAHLFEHMMFRGSPSFPEPNKTMSKWGGTTNAFTSFDITVYYETVPKRYFSEALKFEAERMRQLKITEEMFNTERGAVVSERKMRTEDAPFGRLFWELHQLAFDKHPYKVGPIGWQEDLDAMTLQDALEFYRRFYAPNRAVVAVVGDFTESELLKELNSHFGAMKAEEFRMPTLPVEPKRKKAKRKIVNLQAESVIMAHAVTGLTYAASDLAAESLFCDLMTDDGFGLLHTDLVESGLARSVSANCSPSSDPGLSTIFTVANPGIALQRIEAAFDRSLKKFDTWVSEDRLEKAKMYYIASKFHALRSPDSLAQGLAMNLVLTGDAAFDVKFLDSVKAVKLSDVKRRYQKWSGEPPVRVFVNPAAKNDPFGTPKGARK